MNPSDHVLRERWRLVGAGNVCDEMTAWLLIYATTHGHTAKVARRIAGSLGQENGDVDIRDVKEAREANPADYDAVVAGASLHAGHHQPAMTHWVKRHRVELAARPSAFFSVSLTAADDTEEARVETTKCIDEFVEETGWTPAIVKPIAGALQYLEYDVFTRTLMRLKMGKDGHPTDTSHDYDYTDWDAVDEFGREVATLFVAPSGSV